MLNAFSMKINIDNFDVRTVSCELDGNENVAQLYQKIEQNLNIVGSDFILLFDGAELSRNDAILISDLGMNSTKKSRLYFQQISVIKRLNEMIDDDAKRSLDWPIQLNLSANLEDYCGILHGVSCKWNAEKEKDEIIEIVIIDAKFVNLFPIPTLTRLIITSGSQNKSINVPYYPQLKELVIHHASHIKLNCLPNLHRLEIQNCIQQVIHHPVYPKLYSILYGGEIQLNLGNCPSLYNLHFLGNDDFLSIVGTIMVFKDYEIRIPATLSELIIDQVKQAKSIELNGLNLTEVRINANLPRIILKNLPKLERVSIKGGKKTKFVQLSSFPNLEILTLDGFIDFNGFFMELGHYPKLWSIKSCALPQGNRMLSGSYAIRPNDEIKRMLQTRNTTIFQLNQTITE